MLMITSYITAICYCKDMTGHLLSEEVTLTTLRVKLLLECVGAIFCNTEKNII